MHMATSSRYRVLRVEDGGATNLVVLPTDIRDKLGLAHDEPVWAIQTDDGVLLMSQDAMIEWDRKQVDAALRRQGTSLDEIIETGREIRTELMKERYGIE
jgi:bifunctional DNA-binding transcriptional regulator/antitoxin component of YhaV-PrlF toxin-antitoxin module